VPPDQFALPVGPLVVAVPANPDSRDQSLSAYDPASGRVRWRVTPGGDPLGRQVFASPANVVVARQGTPSSLTVIAARTGASRWTVSMNGAVDPVLATDSQIVAGFVVPERSTGVLATTLVAFDTDSRRELWRNNNFASGARRFVTDGKSLYALVDAGLIAVDARSGNTRWTITATGDPDDTIAGDGVVAVGDNAQVSVYRARDGVRLWQATATVSTFEQNPAALAGDALVAVQGARSCGGD
jgi:hypothetical protein